MFLDRFMNEYYADLARELGTDMTWKGLKNSTSTSLNLDKRTEYTTGDNSTIINLSVPGIQPDKVILEAKDGYLNARYERADDDSCFAESFNYSWRLSERVDTDLISAKFDNGVLAITVPLKKESRSQPRRIVVK